jgi:hypothetical protein
MRAQAMVLPRAQKCSSPVKGAKLRLSADKIDEQSYSEMTLRINYKTKRSARAEPHIQSRALPLSGAQAPSNTTCPTLRDITKYSKSRPPLPMAHRADIGRSALRRSLGPSGHGGAIWCPDVRKLFLRGLLDRVALGRLPDFLFSPL